MWVRIRTLAILAMLIFMILVVLILLMTMLASGWALVRVVLDVVPMLNAEKDAQKEAKDAKLKAARTKHLLDTKAEREAKLDEREAAAKRQAVVRAKV